MAAALAPFPALEGRRGDRVGDLSGGQQQQLALAMALLSGPRLLLVDELSLGLAPVIVAELLPLLGEARRAGTTVVLVEQSLEIALAVADTAVFLEKGQVRFAGAASELRGRHDLLRAVFLPTADSAPPQPAPAGAPPQLASESGAPPQLASESGAPPQLASETGAPPQLASESGAPPQLASETGQDLDELTQVREAGLKRPPQPQVREAGLERQERPPQPQGREARPRFSARALAVAFGGIRALDGVDLDTDAGEIVGIIGPNGAGKTTLFDVMSGFHPGSAGRLWLAGRDVTALGPHARARAGLGRSFQDARLFPALTVEEAVAVACERWARSRDPISAALRLPHAYDSEARITARVSELVDLMGLGPYRSKRVRELSTGTRRVADLACLLAQRPVVILLDEPSSGIAQREVEALGALIRRIRDATGAAMLVVEHDIPLVRTVADRLVAMDQGRVIAEGPPLEVLAHPAVVAAYLGPDAVAVERSTVGGDGHM